MLTTFNFPHDRRSGRTTLAVSMVRDLVERQRIECAYVMPTHDMARDMLRRFDMPAGVVMGAHAFERWLDGRSAPRLVVFDTTCLFDGLHLDRLVAMTRARMRRIDGPTQLVLIP